LNSYFVSKLLFHSNVNFVSEIRIHFDNEILEVLPDDVTLANMKLYETEGSNVEWDYRAQDGSSHNSLNSVFYLRKLLITNF